ARPVAGALVRAAQRGDGLGALAVADVRELRGDLVQRLLPVDLLPLVGAARADALERVVEPVRVLVDLDAGGALDAELALCDGVLPVAVEPHRPAVLDLDEHAAVRGTEGAERALDVAAEGELHRWLPG